MTKWQHAQAIVVVVVIALVLLGALRIDVRWNW